MPETVNGIRVPSEGDPVDLPGDMQRFAEDVGTAAEDVATTAGAAAAIGYASTLDAVKVKTALETDEDVQGVLSATYTQQLDNAATSADGAVAMQKLTKVDASAAARAMTIPDGTIKGQQIAVEKTDTSTNTVTVTGKIRSTGTSSISLAFQYETLLLVWGGTFWEPLAGHRTKASLDATYVPVKQVVRKTNLPNRVTVLPTPMEIAAAAVFSAVGAASSISNPVEHPLVGGAIPLGGSVAEFGVIGGASYATGKHNGTVGSDVQYNLLTVPFETDAPIIEVVFYESAQSFTYRFRVNDEITAPAIISRSGLASNDDRRIILNLGSRQWRSIVLETQNAAIKSITTSAVDTFVAATPKPYKLAAISDSYGIYAAQNGIYYTAAQMLGCDVLIDAAGGTGYLATSGNRTKVRDRLPGLLAANPDGVVYGMGVNDLATSKTPSAVQAEAEYDFNLALASGIAPDNIWAIGAWYTPVYGTPTAINAAIAAACATCGITFIDNIAGGWVTGTGKTTAPAGDGNADIYIGTDGVHPDVTAEDGYRYIGVRLARAIAATARTR